MRGSCSTSASSVSSGAPVTAWAASTGAAAREHRERRQAPAARRAVSSRSSTPAPPQACAAGAGRRAAPRRARRGRRAGGPPARAPRAGRRVPAASSIASGSPSSRRQISTTAGRRPRAEREVGIARSRDRDEQLRPPPPCACSSVAVGAFRGSASGSSRNSRSARIRSGSRLVARTVSLWGGRDQPATTGAASSTCSKLSSTSSTHARPDGAPAPSGDSPGSGRRPAPGRSSSRPARTLERRQRHERRAVAQLRRQPPAPSSTASRVFPTPAGPTTVTKRTAGCRAASAAGDVRLAPERRGRRQPGSATVAARPSPPRAAAAALLGVGHSAGSCARIARSSARSSLPGSIPSRSTSASRARR